MSGFARASRLIALLLLGAGPAPAETPARVVSLNLCTDQMALSLAPDLLLAVSPIAHDPISSPVAEKAAEYPSLTGTAEDIFLLAPDLVLAGSYSERATVDMLRRLGIRVEEFPPATSLDDVDQQMRRMGDLLGRETEAEAQLAEFRSSLASLQSSNTTSPRAIAYFANGYSLGNGTLVGAVIEAAGLRNISADSGLTGGAMISLEDVVLAQPDMIISGERYAGSSRSESILDHPALQKATAGTPSVIIPDRDWICGTPHILAAIEKLAAAAGELQ